MPQNPERRVVLNHESVKSIQKNDWSSVEKTLRRLGLNTFNEKEAQRVREYLNLRRRYLGGEISSKELDQESREFTERIIQENGDEKFFEKRGEILRVVSRALSKN